jgi:hypothetical protein
VTARTVSWASIAPAKYGGKQARLLARLLATIRWLQEVDGTRATYDLLSACADDLLTNWPDQAA